MISGSLHICVNPHYAVQRSRETLLYKSKCLGCTVSISFVFSALVLMLPSIVHNYILCKASMSALSISLNLLNLIYALRSSRSSIINNNSLPVCSRQIVQPCESEPLFRIR